MDGEQGGALHDDVYSDVDSEGFVEDMRAFGVKQAFPLQADGIDVDAAEYLRAVRDEAARIPFVSCAEQRPTSGDSHLSGGATALHEAPDPIFGQEPMFSWMCDVLDAFVAARAEVSAASCAGRMCQEPTLPHVQDRRAWQRLIGQASFQPFSATLARMDNLLAGVCLAALAEDAARADAATLCEHDALWMYGLMVRLEKPVSPDVAASLRQIARLARERRERHVTHFVEHTPMQHDVQGGHGAGPNGAVGAAAAVPALDTLLVVAGGFFGQDAAVAPLADLYLSS